MQTSDQINELAAALVQARQAFTALKKTRTATVASAKGSYKYSFSTLDDLYDATTPALCRAGIVALHNIETAQATIGVSTRLLHQSGRSSRPIRCWLPVGISPQSVGSAITYARRYSLSAALGVAAEDDDDGQGARAKEGKPRRPYAAEQGRESAGCRTNPLPSPSPGPGPAVLAARGARVITDAQRKRLFTIAKQQSWSDGDLKALLAQGGYTSSKDIRQADYDAIIRALETGEVRQRESPATTMTRRPEAPPEE